MGKHRRRGKKAGPVAAAAQPANGAVAEVAVSEPAPIPGEQSLEPVERATSREVSRQPRFAGQGRGVFGSVMRWLDLMELELPAYGTTPMARDAKLRQAWRKEPRLAGVMNAVTLIDSNRGWSMVGGRNQVNRCTAVLHSAEGGAGWRTFSRKASLSYWATDMGSLTETARDGEGGPLRGLYHLDSARCRLTGDPQLPLEYYPAQGGQQRWKPGDFFRVSSLPSDDEALYGLGFCAVSRCIEVARVLYAVLVHDQEQLAARAPRGLLLLHGPNQDQWNEAMKDRDAILDSKNDRYYGAVTVLASAGAEQLDAKLIALSQLPIGFDEKTFLDLSMYAYALCFGYDPSEFWPVQFGALGRGTETEVQHRKATGKGGLDFVLAFQEQLQLELPETLQFEFDQRDEQGDLLTARLQQEQAKSVRVMYDVAGMGQQEGLITREEGRQLLAERGLIPEEWTAAEEEVEGTDVEEAGEEEEAPEGEPVPEPERRRQVERWLDGERVRRAMALWPREEIVRYSWTPQGSKTEVLWRPRMRPRLYAVVKRQDAEDVLYQDEEVTITEGDVDRAIHEAGRRVGPEFEELLTAPTLTDEQLAKLGG